MGDRISVLDITCIRNMSATDRLNKLIQGEISSLKIAKMSNVHTSDLDDII
ncbi:16600_t:CDS:1, partial [Racocetra fulgida]